MINFIQLMKVTSVFLLIYASSSIAYAKESVGKVIIFSGVVAAKDPGGKLRVLSRKSEVFKKDVITTEKDSYARIRFTDGSLLVMRPESTISIDEYHFSKNSPKKDAAVINLLEGGLRTITGLIGKRGNKDSYKTKTRHASIGIRGTIYGVLLCEGSSCAGLSGKQRPTRDGQYVNVSKGRIVIRNNTGIKSVKTGQFAFIPSSTTSIKIMPKDPGHVRFIEPKATNSSQPASSKILQPEDLGCIVQ